MKAFIIKIKTIKTIQIYKLIHEIQIIITAKMYNIVFTNY
jgi:hypothetical protein